MNAPFAYATLGNGIRAVHIASHSPIDLAGVMVDAGSRMDPSVRPGLAHFVEHTIFKGTAHRRAWHINNRMESIGGEINAFTSKEETIIYTVSPGGHLPRALQLVSELITEPTFRPADLDIEREVILDEIDSYLDSPPDAVFDDFEDAFLAGSGLGHNILGTRQSVSAISGDDCRHFVEQWYTPSRLVVFYSGLQPSDRVFATLERYFSSLRRPDSPFDDFTPEAATRFDTQRHIEGAHQANTVAGVRTGGIDSPDRFAMALLCNILGGPGMNSLLNTELRERRGLVYSVEATLSRYSDCGVLALSWGCDPSDSRRCRRLIDRVLGHMLPRRLTDRNIELAKRQFLGQVAVGSDNRENTAFRAARSTCHFGRVLTDTEFADIILGISPDTLRHMAASALAPDAFSSLTLL